MKIVLILILFGCAVVHSAHMNVNDLNSDYIQNILIKSTSNISNIDIPNACQTQLLYMSQNWKRLNIFPSKLTLNHSKLWTHHTISSDRFLG